MYNILLFIFTIYYSNVYKEIKNYKYRKTKTQNYKN